MITFFAVQQNLAFNSGWLGCIDWAREQLQNSPAPVQILLARAGEKTARVVAEITPDGARTIRQGREVKVKGLMRYG